jgi:hypothetical protein
LNPTKIKIKQFRNNPEDNTADDDDLSTIIGRYKSTNNKYFEEARDHVVVDVVVVVVDVVVVVVEAVTNDT